MMPFTVVCLRSNDERFKVGEKYGLRQFGIVTDICNPVTMERLFELKNVQLEFGFLQVWISQHCQLLMEGEFRQ